jgi:tripartite-type tricarboxylate transporter receptor subunit TctC
VPVATFVRVPNVMAVNPSFPAKTVPEFIAYTKANPGKVNMASAGNGTVSHIAGELFKMMSGINMLHVPYRGGPPALTDLIGGQVQVMFDNVASSIEHLVTALPRDLVGRKRAIADMNRLAASAQCVENDPDRTQTWLAGCEIALCTT